MVKRFIQFNDETIDANQLLLYERLGRALADAPFLELTERKLMEFRPREGAISMSVFWRHRSEHMTHLGRLSDLYLLTAGFWKDFSVVMWLQYREEYQTHKFPHFCYELLLLLEEFRLSEKIQRERPGTVSAFEARREAMLAFHRDSLATNVQKNFLADALLNKLFISLHAGMYADHNWNGEGLLDLGPVLLLIGQAYDASSTKENTCIAERITGYVEEVLEKDLTHQYYALGDSITEENVVFHYHEGMQDAEQGEDQTKETIEEVFRTWHRESEDEAGVHLQYELEHGRSGKGDGTDAVEGNSEASIEEIGHGRSEGKESEQWQEDQKNERKTGQRYAAGHEFGREHTHVMFEEQRIVSENTKDNIESLALWREVQKPFVRAFSEEIRKRIEMKTEWRRERLLKGRLSSKLTTMIVDERPKPFYRKQAPSANLDAVFGLLVDGSASMLDKLDETKMAVLLFHDVLRSLKIQHEISSYYEDAEETSKDLQLNRFGMMHTFQDRNKDSGLSILSFEANEDNRDGFAIRWMTKRLMRRSEKHKFLLVFSDGEPSAFGYDRNGILDTREAVLEAEKQDISVIHLFLSAEEPTEDQRELFSRMFGNKTASAHSVESFADQTLRILRKLLAIVIK
ncbi:nitric oxide reductase activation protein [Sporosarcina luteola]|nr:nitric oxide reductase activation protein [Sporosarcina luteola]